MPGARRLLWLVMALAHAPALLGAWQALASEGVAFEPVARCAGLTLAVLFFALKTNDSAFFPLPTDRRSIVAICMVVGLMHVDVVRPVHDPTLVADTAALVAATGLAVSLRPVRRALREALRMARSPFECRQLGTHYTDGNCVDDARPHDWLLVLGLFSLRAPPV